MLPEKFAGCRLAAGDLQLYRVPHAIRSSSPHNKMKRIPAFIFSLTLPLLHGITATPNLATNIERPLRYHPDGTDFVIENGAEFFNRPLYGMNTAFRVDAGDRPEFSLYLPGRGGNLRIGMKTAAGAKWLFDAEKIVARYRPGSMLYEVHDPLLGGGTLRLTALPMDKTEGLIVRAELTGADNVELVWAYGGANGQRGSRDGDIGCEKVPVSEFFQLKPEFCKDDEFTIHTSDFTMRSKAATIVGLAPDGSKLALADAKKWSSLGDLLAVAGRPVPEFAVVVGQAPMHSGAAIYLALQRIAKDAGGGELQTYKDVRTDVAEKKGAQKIADLPPAYEAAQLAQLFTDAEKHRREIAEKIVVETPDPFINAAASALCVAADGVWDESAGAFMHGAVAWRTRLLGWRGPYSGDALGWHDRTERHLMNWFPKQNTEPVTVAGEPAQVPQDAGVNFARDEPELHSNGDLSRSHYDMNLPAIDVFFRHILWTGDVDFARKNWPVIERHLAWERRLFRREFGPEKLPLYEAYCCIWASDDLQYEGGGAAHSTAYNFYHNKMAARIARQLGLDSKPYEDEADLISNAMRSELWLPDRGWFAEWKDLLGLQLTHPNAALWTFYHTVDSEVPTPMEAWQMTRFVDTQIAHIPLRGAGVPEGFCTVPTTSWMPYTWSTNNVVMAEVAHTSLAYWQAGRGDEAFRLFKGCVLDSMFMGLCPGNVGMCTQFDIARREAQRDFADGCGMTSRALVEGLFGVKPDALAGELFISPGFPAEWDHAKINHPDFNFAFRREGMMETFLVEPKFSKPMRLKLEIPARGDKVVGVTVNGSPVRFIAPDGPWPSATVPFAQCSNAENVGAPRIRLMIRDAAPSYKIVVEWAGNPPSKTVCPAVVAQGTQFEASVERAALIEVSDPQKSLSGFSKATNKLTATANDAIGHRSFFVKVNQGDLRWWLPVAFEIRPAFEIVQSERQDAEHFRFRFRNNTPVAIDGNADIFLGGKKFASTVRAAAMGDSDELALPANAVSTGTARVRMKLADGIGAEGTLVNWKVKSDAATKWETVDLGAVFNDRVTQIFKNEYLSPRSPYCSLAIPKQGIGSWIHWNPATDKFAACDVDDSGLRAVADKNNGRLILPSGIPFQTAGTGDAKNIAFTSQWDNYPREIAVPLIGSASHIYLLMAGSTNSMQSQFDNGEVVVAYADGSTERLALRNPTTWWPIDQNYFIDDYAFRRPEATPPRVDLKTGIVRVPDIADFKGKGGKIDGGAATVLDLPLNASKELKSLTVRTIANEVVTGLMSATLAR